MLAAVRNCYAGLGVLQYLSSGFFFAGFYVFQIHAWVYVRAGRVNSNEIASYGCVF